MHIPKTLPRLDLARWAAIGLPLAILGVMLLINPTLRRPEVWGRIGRNWAGYALLAFALTPIIITGGIDLSVGSVVSLAAVLGGFLWRGLGWPLAGALAGCVLAGLAAGTANGVLILGGINPLVVTLATLVVFRGLAHGISGPDYVQDFPASLLAAWEGSWLGVPVPVWIILAGFGVFHVLLHHTWMGRMLYAIGDNVQAARYAAVPVRTLTFGLYVLSGLVAGLVGLTSICKSQAAPPDVGDGLEFIAIACVVLGGVRITGGAGHLAGTLLGTLTLAALWEGMTRVPGRWRPIATGAFLVTVAILNESLARWRSSREAEKMGR